MNLDVIYNEDCIEGMRNIPDKSIDLIVTDPPYLHVKGGMKNKKLTGSWDAESFTNKNMSDFGEKEINTFLDIANSKMKKMNMYIFCSKLQLQFYFKWIYEHKKKYDLLIWDKQKRTMKSTKFHTSDIDYIIRIYESGVSLNRVSVDNSDKADVSFYTKLQVYTQPKGEHETMKPVELVKKYILLSSNEGDVVLDPFIGSGTTAIACLETGRHYIGYELDTKHFNIAQDRILDYELEE